MINYRKIFEDRGQTKRTLSYILAELHVLSVLATLILPYAGANLDFMQAMGIYEEGPNDSNSFRLYSSRAAPNIRFLE